jgi:MFS family permease
LFHSTAHNPGTGNLIAAMAAVGCCDIAMGLTLQLLPLLMDKQGVAAWLIGLNTAMGPIGILATGPFLPRLLGNIGTKKAAFLIVALLAVILAVISVSPFWAWFPLRFLFGILVGALFTISEAWVLTFSDERNRGRVMGLYTSVLAVTFSVGPLIVPWTGIEGWLPWTIGIACFLVSAVPLALVKIDSDGFKQQHAGSFFAFIKKAPLLLCAVGAVTLFDNVFISFFTIYGLRHGVELDVASRILGIGIIGNVLMFYPIGLLADRWSRRGVIVISSVLTVVLALSLLIVINHWTVWPVVVLLSTSAFGVYVVSLAVMGDSFKGPDVIAGSAAFAAMWGVGGLFGPPLAGLAIDTFGINAMPVTLASFYVLLLVGLAWSRGQLVRTVSHG